MRFLILFLVSFTMLWAGSVKVSSADDSTVDKTPLAMIKKIKGKAKVLPATSIKKHNAVLEEILFAGDRLIAYMDTQIVVQLEDNSTLVLNENSELTFMDNRRLKQERGEVYYKIEKRGQSKGLKVETPFSIIGIKGTEFIVDTNESNREIALNEGLIGVESLRAEFELHKKEVMAEYEAFKSEQMQAFEAYKAEARGEVISYVKAFDLKASKRLQFNDASRCEQACESKVNELDFTDDTAQRFAFYKAVIEE